MGIMIIILGCCMAGWTGEFGWFIAGLIIGVIVAKEEYNSRR